MAYNKFKKLDQIRSLGLASMYSEWLPDRFEPFYPSDALKSFLVENKREAIVTEKAKSEAIIYPLIRELSRKNPDAFASFSGVELTIEGEEDLSGFCDFILTKQVALPYLSAPIFCLVEAKKDDIDSGIAQCGAEMYAAQIFNEREGNPRETIYGCVTNAFSWCFLKLNKKTLYIDPNYVPLTFTEPHRVLATLQWILDEALEEGTK